ncbi:hypothetical protein Vadar_021301 [Vaccinium darrowii]|uniref:Uncharacterized protein n=1 Tax=Vaccinium darrowii TaxID=229202 RepID=A0ACB7XS02_9ERIC|nr:hypothetical protein Vadar_021301 [Vaccinium darrowii]
MLSRAKVYQLNKNGKWVDQGTGHVSVDYLERSGESVLFVIDEKNKNGTLLMHRISSDDIYRRQEDTTISWRDPEDSTERTLRFQEATGCSYIWDQINAVQLKSRTFSNSQEEVGDSETSVNPTEGDRCEWLSAPQGDTQNSEPNLASFREPHVTADQRAAQSVGDSEQASQAVESRPPSAFTTRSTNFFGFHVNQQHLDLLKPVRDAPQGDTQNSEPNLASFREPHVTADQRAAQSVGDSEQASQAEESRPPWAFTTRSTNFLGFHVNQQHLDLLKSVRDAHPDTFSGLSYSPYIGGMLLDNFAVVLRTLCNTSVSQFKSYYVRTARASVTDFEKLGFKLEWLAPRIEQVYAQRKESNLKLEIEEKQNEIREKQREIEELHSLLGRCKSKLAFLVQEDQNPSETSKPALGRDDSILKGLFAL